MNFCGIHRTHLNSANHIFASADTGLSSSGLSSGRSSLTGELSSYWYCSGRLNCDLHKQLKGYIRSALDSEIQHFTITCIHNVKDVRQLTLSEERLPAVFPINLNSCLRGWLSQLFNASANKETKQEELKAESQPGGFESVLLNYGAEKGIDPSQSYMMHPFTSIESLSSCEKLQEDSIDPRVLAEVAINDMVSAIPSINALQMLPYFDMLHCNLIQAPGTARHPIANKRTSHGCIEKAQSRNACRDQFVSPDELGSPAALASWLSDRLPLGISQWGNTPGTKGVTNLWIELKEGEIMLEDAHPPLRTVHVASVKIRNKAGHMLVEAHQEMVDGSIRLRNRPLSEKIRPGEDVEEACFRGIFEELGSHLGARNRVRIFLGSYRRELEERESLSYPGLLTSYVIHSVDAIIEDLPETGFYTVEDELMGHNSLESGALSPHGSEGFYTEAALGVKKHFWRWVPQPS